MPGNLSVGVILPFFLFGKYLGIVSQIQPFPLHSEILASGHSCQSSKLGLLLSSPWLTNRKPIRPSWPFYIKSSPATQSA